MPRIGFTPEDDPERTPEVVPLHVENPNAVPGWWDDDDEDDDVEWEF